jgi:hypothetical protein
LGALGLAMSLSAKGAAQEPRDNLIRNGDFSEISDESPKHWKPVIWGGQASFDVDFAVGRTETPAVRISSTEGADASWSFRAQLKPHTQYRLSAWIKTSDVSLSGGLGVQLNLHELQMEGKSVPISGTNDWTEITTEFNSGSHDSLLVNLLFGGWGQAVGTAWFDDVRLEATSDALPVMTEADAATFFDNRIRPILEQRCLECHGNDPDDLAGELALNHLDAIVRGGESGPAIDLQAPADSLILEAINYETFEMPPDGKLPQADIDALTTWIKIGAPWGTPFEISKPIGDGDESHKKAEPEVNEETKQWWSFQPVRRPDPPAVADASWPHNDIDRFILAKLEAAGLTPAPPASRRTLIRRATYDLTGLPPTLAEVQQFVDDPDPDAFNKLVDRLLDSPHYGEKWGRHWLDLVRYAESNSFERDGTKPFVWRYRDYVIRSFNDDKPYDQFLCEQLAGDELPEVTTESIAATGYFRLGAWDDEPADPLQARYDDLDDILATTSQAMFGLTVNCARCHDHKIDPIPQADYYRLLAFFNNIRRYGVRDEKTVLDASVRSMGQAIDPQQQAEYERQIADLEARTRELEERVAADFIPVEIEEFRYPRNRIPMIQTRVGRVITQAEFESYRDSVGRLEKLKNNPPAGEVQVLCVKEQGSEPPRTNILIRGNPHVLGSSVDPGFPSVLSPPNPDIQAPRQGETWGGRLAFADWLTQPENPLTARVMANRIWQYHFGRGIVRTSNDFGFQGSPPTHPQLLDWLAAEFVARGWSLKSMHRLIMNSAAYQMSSVLDVAAYDHDPVNDLFWRFDVRRLTAEELRDSMLAVSDSLNLRSMYGPSVFSELAPEVLAGQSRPGDGWGESSPEDRARRSIYIHIKRSLKDPILENFDAADTDFTCPVRFVTTQPTQALGMLNGRFADAQAEALANRVRQLHPDDRGRQVEEVMARVTQRSPSAEEREGGLQMLDDLVRAEGCTEEQALKYFCLMALNLNEFVYLD